MEFFEGFWQAQVPSKLEFLKRALSFSQKLGFGDSRGTFWIYRQSDNVF